MRRHFLHALAALLIVALLPACALGKGRKEKKRAAAEERLVAHLQAPQLIGTIALVNEENGFVLINNEAGFNPPLGTVVKARSGAVESAELRLTEIRRRPFLIADIVKGRPQKGDEVFHARH